MSVVCERACRRAQLLTFWSKVMYRYVVVRTVRTHCTYVVRYAVVLWDLFEPW